MNSEKQIARIERYETQALELGDLKTAMKLNWLRNALRFDGYNVADSVERMQEIVLGIKQEGSNMTTPQKTQHLKLTEEKYHTTCHLWDKDKKHVGIIYDIVEKLYIVRAVNCHEELLTLVKHLRVALLESNLGRDLNQQHVESVIAKAEGGK